MEKVNVSLRNQSFYLNYARGYENSKDMNNYHLHQDYEIFYMIEGEKAFTINGTDWVAKSGHLLFINKNVLHKSKVNDERYQRIVLNFKESFPFKEDIPLIIKLFHHGPLMLAITKEQSHFIKLLFEKMLSEYHTTKGRNEYYLRLLLSQLLIECDRLKYVETNTRLHKYGNRTNYTVINEIIMYINANYDTDLTLAHLSNQFFLNQQYISRMFKQSTGCSFIEYVNAIRVNEAKRLLIETDKKIAHIAKLVGYTSHVHFWRIFKSLTGDSPNDYRDSYVKM
ncbi:helix-turn-helix domain-containing protein [Gracilibacillus marinus]|uniref:Helix-turn-helix domain-containing protein n=1 Tax=Gracilibacillus marinus TaxID=630535 RepID=A0ABV8VSS6_9BACI